MRPKVHYKFYENLWYEKKKKKKVTEFMRRYFFL